MEIDWMAPLQVIIKYNLLLWVAGAMYALFNKGLFALGAQHQNAVVTGNGDTGQFAEGYFVMLASQTVPLLLTGILNLDPFIIGTRGATLLMVLIVYAMVSSKNGTFFTERLQSWVGFWLTILIVGPLIWGTFPSAHGFVREWEVVISWTSVLLMFAFVIKGQLGVAKTLFRHFIAGNYTFKRMRLQVIRFFGFALPMVHYYFAPTSAEMNLPIWVWAYIGHEPMALDSIFINQVMGTCGVAIVLISAGIGLLFGSRARDRKRASDHKITYLKAA